MSACGSDRIIRNPFKVGDRVAWTDAKTGFQHSLIPMGTQDVVLELSGDHHVRLADHRSGVNRVSVDWLELVEQAPEEEPKDEPKRYRVNVRGPGITDRFGAARHTVASPDDVTTNSNGELVITEPPAPERPHPAGHGTLRARPSMTFVYAKGVWSNVSIVEL